MVGCYNNANGWTGVPLISTAARRPRKFPPVINGPNGPGGSVYQNTSKVDFDENAMSRLALHAHGAPLILTNNNRYNRSNSSNQKPGPNKPKQVPSNHAPARDDHLHHLKMVQAMGHAQMSHAVDTHSVASDESGPNSGTTNSSASSSSSDTCLPRIIKPRKRRKKDRKPAATPTPSSEQPQTTPTPTTSNGGPQHPVNQLLLDETTRDFLHEIALMANAGTFDFSGLPLIREQQQPTQIQPPQQQPPQQQQHFSSSNSDSSDSGINNLACSCRLCDPFCKIWAFPLRRSCSDNSAEIELNRAKDVGVIGSNRSNSFRSEWRSSPHSLEQGAAQQEGDSSRKGSFSDSGDSGCDLLSGLTFCSEDILGSVNRELFATPVDGGREFKFPMTGGGGVASGNSISGSGSPNSVTDNNSELLSISELTKKLNEGLDLRSSGGSSDSGSSAFSDSVFGEGSPPGSGASSGDLFVNFDAISRNNLFSANNISKLSNLLFDDGLTAPGLVINSGHSGLNNNNVLGGCGGANGTAASVNYIRNKNVQNLQQPPPPPPPVTSSTATPVQVAAGSSQQRPLFSEHQPFIFVPDADRANSHCFDMVWSNDRKQLLPVEE